MKKYYIFVFLVFSIIGKAQIVNIPDPDFKTELLYVQNNIDTNHDGEIQVSEALAVTSLGVGGMPGSNIQNLTGLSAFTNLTSLQLGYTLTNITTLDLSPFPALQTLSVSAPLTSLDLSPLVNLQALTLYSTQMPTLTISGLNNLKGISLQGNLFESLTLGALPHLESVDLYGNQSLTSLTFTATPQIRSLSFAGCYNLVSVDITGLSQLEALDASSSGLTSLNVSGLSNLKDLYCYQSYNLSSIITTGANAITTLYAKDTALTSLEVSQMTGLQVLHCGHDINSQFTDGLTALNVSGLTQLTSLNCEGNKITSLDVSSLTSLAGLNCSRNLIISLNVTPLAHLLSLNCSFNQITSLGTLPISLTDLDCSGNQLNALNVSGLIHMNHLSCGANQLSSLDVSNLVNLEGLACYGNQLTALDLTHQTKLVELSCGDNLISTIDLSNLDAAYLNATGSLAYLNFNSSPNLEFINMKFGPLNYFSSGFYDCPNLLSICVDEANIPSVQQSIMQSMNAQEISVNTYCNFVPGGIYNTITGIQTFDGDNNGCDTADLPLMALRVNINDGTDSGATFTNANGQYQFQTRTGTFTLTPVLSTPYFAVSPSSATINFAALDNTTQTQNFCITPLGIHYDVEIALIPIRNARPGFDAEYKLVYKNIGNQILSGNISLGFDDDLIDFISSNPVNSSQSTSLLTWNYINLYPFESREIYLTFNVNSPQEVPAVNIGDNLNYFASITINGQEDTPGSNTFNLDQTVVGSFDPNDKTCLEGNTITPEMVGGYLHYLIRFQNSGTAAAENIVVKDIIDTTKFDISSLQLTGSSHPQVTKITGNKVEFQFENINLPAEISDEPGSHGYVAFKIKTKGNLVIGNSVANKAGIYFDYNFPIETNTATSTVALLGLNTFENTSVNVTPNPTKNIVHITSKGNITSVQLFDVQGRILETLTTNAEQLDFDLSQKTTGVYFVKIITEKGTKTEKIIKE